MRALCDQHGVVLIFDEVKTGLTAGPAGAAQRLGVQPDLITLAKSIGGGFPLAAFGGKREVMEVVVDGRMAHFGTYNGNPLVMAAARAVDEICTPEALDGAEAINVRALDAIADAIIGEYELPAHTVGFGVKGCITWSTDAGAQLPRLQGDRLRPRRAVLALGRQPAASSRRLASTSSGWSRWPTPTTTWGDWSRTSPSWPRRCAAETRTQRRPARWACEPGRSAFAWSVVEPPQGVEPWTYALRVRRSAD